MNFISFIKSAARALFAYTVLATGLMSCSTIFTDQSQCPKGVSLSFRYEYNMEYANSFHSQVHCLSLLVFDGNGRFVSRFDESSDALGKEDYAMSLELDEGHYTLLAYGGIACADASFDLYCPSGSKAAESDLQQFSLQLRSEDSRSSSCLHPCFYGIEEIDIENSEQFIRDTVYMLKNTNNIRVVLQQIDGVAMSSGDFVFTITDDNSVLDWTDAAVPSTQLTYLPWTKGETVIGEDTPGTTPASAVWAEFSTSRLFFGNAPRLRVANAESGETVIDLPLIDYLMLLRSELFADMSKQEFLDRESVWSLVFFLDNGLRWLDTRIVINDWVVRLNHTEM